MKIRSQFLAISLAILAMQAYSSSALISSETVTPPSPKAISDLKDAIVKGLGLHTSDLKLSRFDARDARVGQAVAYEFHIQINKKRSIPIKLLEDVSQWSFADPPLFGTNGGDESNSLAEMEGKGKRIRVLPELPPFQLAGPMELWIQDGDDMRLALPHDVEAGALKKVVLSDGAVVTVKGARSVSLRDPIDLPLPFNRSVVDPARHASGLLALAQALRQQAATSSSSQKPLLSLRIVGPTSLSNSPNPSSSNDRLKLKRLAPGLVQLSVYDGLGMSVDQSESATLWPLTSVNGSSGNLRGFEELLASVLGKEGEKKGSFKLVKAQVSAQTYVKMGFEVEKQYIDTDFDKIQFPEWKTRPEKGRAHFEVLARVEEGGKVVPERIAQVRPFEMQETVVDSMVSGNVSVSKVETVHPVPVYFTL